MTVLTQRLTSSPASDGIFKRDHVCSGGATSTTILLALLLVVSLLMTKAFQWSAGASYATIRDEAGIKPVGDGSERKAGLFYPFVERLRLTDGASADFSCSAAKLLVERENGTGGENSHARSCGVYLSGRYLLKFQLWDVADGRGFRSYIQFFPAPEMIEGGKKDGGKIVLSDHERKFQSPQVIAELEVTSPVSFDIKYDIEKDSLRALFVSQLQTGARLEQARIEEFSIDRLSKVMVARMDDITGLFSVRAQWQRLLFGGTFQTIVIFVFSFSGLLTMVAFVGVFVCEEESTKVRRMAELATSLGGSLTYFGLLGTLLGIFLAVHQLSAIDFVDEMRKVFDQTRSFGDMSLALGSSVLGLGGALTLWIVQSIMNFVIGRRLFEI
ncbi:MotA/TolQ/ExbB proton channel family protein [Bradyrhizobium diazoefficiens]|nr:MotA/TolQ/ExbB proton channel family protein [Bradyrhizobium diazoefficiens]MBR0967097.1 MotA/TolQ/ExbB proton channel family protein [Bradyrhizobium diazoefficiens]MBR0979087.1 MotA/TolQ/ExbB proton channel family protein [Bradyrhizobium diazoefficiens]MBR1010146.1 MotA/TolQ/ExbB proton channel family protein [Bradyrhizobium diazoefficiens]MBR1017374.1 MotA/TolQ/ExbB proton channel family protein [Bradyrhizobium diazoefficiens]MBR1054844.1 MotA/TolQ/ExbB proton channel family protein [Brad